MKSPAREGDSESGGTTASGGPAAGAAPGSGAGAAAAVSPVCAREASSVLVSMSQDLTARH
ncbi:hypothetical protein GCM10010389_34720 [Streptomyces echinoruber]|uniref:Uncharacterized protein n=1 Tax=Streptomyces echinoruber TaxID=68898 RepID=A0A918RDA0_9ACTN|nr:hypothetical protein GCM10010389_34720 [Streptomyces echinoruber]